MRTRRIATNFRCNQNCTYCTARLPTDDLAGIRPSAVRARIDDALAADADEVILTGGEPLLRADVEGLVEHARKARPARLARVTIETNATLVDTARAEALARAGLDLALVNLAGATSALDAVTRDPGGFDATVAGIRALSGAGVRVEAQAAVVRSTRDALPGVPAVLAGLGVRTLWLVVPTESPDPSELLDWPEAAHVVASVEAAADTRGVFVRFGHDVSLPPCALPAGTHLEHLYSSLTPGAARREGYRHLEACAGCLVRDRCSGVAESYLARHPRPAMRPVTADRSRRRLTLMSSVEDQMNREFVTANLASAEGGVPEHEDIIRINFRCNQACEFCFVSTHLPSMPDAAVREAILDAARRGARVVLSGGEPTLNPHLLEYVALAKAHSTMDVQLQTNAIKLDDASFVERLAGAGLALAFVSLHGSTADVSDRVTSAPGTFVRTVVGLDNLARSSIKTILNFVLCQANYRDFPNLARLVAARWPKAEINVSFVAPSADVVPRDPALIPRYSDVMPFVAEGITLAHAGGVNVIGFESMCGLPLCLVPPSIAPIESATIPPGFDRGEFVKTDACQGCSLDARCYGLRRGYAAMHGTGELRAVRAAS
jgi:MoaA/NifB/PqqE/SkfB family radical SAM enzyme